MKSKILNVFFSYVLKHYMLNKIGWKKSKWWKYIYLIASMKKFRLIENQPKNKGDFLLFFIEWNFATYISILYYVELHYTFI